MIQRMYIGPAIPGVVKRGTVFYGDLPKELTDAAEKIPGVKNLVIPVEKITGATQALKERGSVEYVSWRRVSDYLEEVKRHGI